MPTSPTVAMPAASTGSEPAFSEQEDGSSAGPPSSIVSIPTSAVHRLVAGQAVTDLASAVKELVDNAIDAGATSINIRLFNQGIDIVEVTDDGSGVPLESRPLLAMKHATSKIRTFDNIYEDSATCLTTSSREGMMHVPGQKQLGFRGEALFCLANLSQKLVVSTRTATNALGQKMEFSHDGKLLESSITDMPRKVGTTVAVVKLFDALPVRRADMIKRIKAQRAKMLRLMQSYAILCRSIRFNLIDITGEVGSSKSRSEVKLATSASSKNIEQTVSSVLGSKFLAGLTRLHVDLTPFMEDDNTTAGESGISVWKIDGLVSLPGSSSRDLQFFSVNGRPVELPKLSRALGEIWRTFGESNGKKRPACVLALTLPNHMYDVNLNPDKRDVLLSRESLICDALREALRQLWSSHTDGTFAANEVETMSNPNKSQTPAGPGVSAYQEMSLMPLPPGLEPVERQRRMPRRNGFVRDPGTIRPTQGVYHDHSIGSSNPETKQMNPPVHDVQTIPTMKLSSELQMPPIMPQRKGFIHDPATAHPTNAVEYAPNHSSDMQMDIPFDPTLGKPPPQALPTDVSLQDGSTDTNHLSFVAGTYVSETVENENIETRVDSDASMNISGTHEDKAKNGHELQKWAQMREDFTNLRTHCRDEERHLLQDKETPSSHRHAPVYDNEYGAGGNQHMENGVVSTLSQTISNRAPLQQNVTNSSQRPRRTIVESKLVTLHDFEFKSGDDNTSRKKRARLSLKDDEFSTEESNGERVNSLQRKTGSRKRNKHNDNSEEAPDSRLDDESRSDPVSMESIGILDAVTTEQAPSQMTEPVIWNCFADTHSVVKASQAARLGMRSNRKGLQRKIHGRQNASNGTVDPGGILESVGVPVEEESRMTRDTRQGKFVSLTKDDFPNMEVIGQFNLGFILARCKNYHLWILDQHGCDEKYNFEKLCANTVLHEQKLMAPLPLELSPSEENCIMDNMEVFEKNGFRFSYDATKPPRHRLSLTALPHSGARDGRKAVQFGEEDVGALCAMLGADGASSSSHHGGGSGADGAGMYGNNAVRRYAGTSTNVTATSGNDSNTNHMSSSSVVRLPKAVAMFASRACRSSIMIGKPLSQKEMETVVHKMHGVDQPWNCPHGRPTMRHVRDMLGNLLEDEMLAAEHVAGPSLAILSQEEALE
eukprot:CAMPEP_0198304578 /NCGR_PEP_ID=MMETSP1449-20131203/57472_1 /TAXON_ID=420275 /ORGANISM="Attheya septentrionalis, Strain CCMP2084" /LENGTH=1167 /DNA_ID=CAMNT_0044007103 /DNA_START=237 /DNA_END=3740 /DNA_ORIENTATION=+